MLRDLGDLITRLGQFGKGPAAAHSNWQSARSQLSAAKKTIAHGLPAVLCFKCKGKCTPPAGPGEEPSCQTCRGSGYVTRDQYDRREEAVRHQMEAK